MTIKLSAAQLAVWDSLPKSLRAVARRSPVGNLSLDDVVALRSGGKLRESDLLALEVVFRGGGVMLSRQIGGLAYPSLRTRAMQNRLRRLFDLGLLERAWWEGRWPVGEAESPRKHLVHYLSPIGGQVAVVRLEGLSFRQARRQVRVAERMLSGNRLLHDLVAVEVWLALDRVIRSLGGRVEWWGGRLVFQRVQDESGAVRAFAPDGLATLVIAEREQSLWVEVDMATEPLRRIRRKVRRAELAFKAQKWRETFEAFPQVLLVTWGSRRADNIAVEVGKAQQQPGVTWLVCSLEEIEKQGIAGPIWRMPGQAGRLRLLS